MKKGLFILLLSISFSNYSSAQVFCIKCYDQDARVLTDTNNLIVNGGFENGCAFNSQFCPNAQFYSCDISNWKCTGGGVNTYARIIGAIAEGTKAAYFGNFFCYACSGIGGDTSCINNIGCEVTGIPVGYPYNRADYGGTMGVSLEQTVNGLTSGIIYLLEFWAGGELGFSEKGIFAVDVGFGNIMFRCKPTSPFGDIGTRYIIAFTAISSSHTIKFTNWGHICATCTELVLDDVRLFAANVEDPCAVAINELNQNPPITVFPNPATNQLTVTTNNNEPSEITLYDITSRKLLQQKFTGVASLNIENFPRGIYLYEVKDGRGVTKPGRLVKQ